MNANQILLEAAADEAEIEYPITDDMEVTERTVRVVLREGFVKGYMKAMS